ncbi:MAG: hypothetical protein HRU20_12015 [Pseudomonadales bacterium]|nr:hypothetical protein [Pseudomonadales bacterium]
MPANKTKNKTLSGMGNISPAANITLRLYLPHRPPMQEFESLNGIKLLQHGDINTIIAATGNHWRKIFVIFSKIAAALDSRQLDWKTYQQNHLLQGSGSELLVFCDDQGELASQLINEVNTQTIHLFSGKACAEAAGCMPYCEALESGFYRSHQGNVFITPYFDYRQLSNVKIDYLLSLLTPLHPKS